MQQKHFSTLKEILVFLIANSLFLINYFLRMPVFFLWSQVEVGGIENDKPITELCSCIYIEDSSKCRSVKHIFYIVSHYYDLYNFTKDISKIKQVLMNRNWK